MGAYYSHVSLEERERLFALRSQGKSFRGIAKVLGRDHKAWSREWKRNRHCHTEEYVPCKAHTKAEKRTKEQRTKAPLKCPEIFLYVREKMRVDKWTPEAISIRIGLDIIGAKISPETIYRYIYGKGRIYKLYEFLPLHHKRRRKWLGRKIRAEKIEDKVLIDNRPQRINSRKEFGHWESDLMEGNRKSEGVVHITAERKTRFLVGKKLPSKHSAPVIDEVNRVANEYIMLSNTSDNGTENAKHKMAKVTWYFCHPYHSWEKGTVENSIGRLRRFFPKGCDLSKVNQSDIDYAIELLNNMPRKCLNGFTSQEAYQKEYDKIRNR